MARIEPVGGGGEASLVDFAECQASNQVGDWVYIANPASPNYVVDTADPTNILKLPASGIIIEKIDPVTCKVQWGGKVVGIVTGLTPGGVIYLGANGTTSHIPHPTTRQPLGVAIDTDELLVNPDWTDIPAPDYSSHLGTTDGATDGRITFPSGTGGRISEATTPGTPFSYFSKDGDWANPSVNKPGTQSTSVSVQTAGDITELDVGTTLRVRFLQYGSAGGGEVTIGEETIACDGTNQVSAPNGWLETTGVHANAGRFEGILHVTIPIDTLISGGGYIRTRVTHEGPAGGPYEEEWEIFYDPYASPPSPLNLAVAENTANLKYLSGIRFYDMGSTFDIDGDVINAFRAMYHQTPILLDLSGFAISGPSSIGYTDLDIAPPHPPTPKWDDALYWLKTLAVDVGDVHEEDAIARQRARDPWNTSGYNDSVSGPFMINTVSPTSDDTDESFDDEEYRLVSNATWPAAPSVPPVAPDKFDGQAVLDNGSNDGAQVIGGELIYPSENYESPASRRPVQQAGTNYSTLIGERDYQRPLRHDTTPDTRSNVVLYLPGLDVIAGDIDPGGSGNLNMFLMLPGVSAVWFDCGRDYFSALFPTSEPGCLVKSLSGVAAGYPTNEYWYFTFGPFSTLPADRTVVVRVVYRNALAPSLTRIRAYNWT